MNNKETLVDPNLEKLRKYYADHPDIPGMVYPCGLVIPFDLDVEKEKQTFLDLASKITFYLEDIAYAERVVPVHIVNVFYLELCGKHFLSLTEDHTGELKNRRPEALYASQRAYWRNVIRKTMSDTRRFLENVEKPDALQYKSMQGWTRELLDLSDEIHRNLVIPFQCHSEHLLPEKKETDS